MKRKLLYTIIITLFISSSWLAQAQNPVRGWKDSFEHNGKCWCDNNTNYDHNLNSKSLRINGQDYNIVTVCEELRKHPDYRDLQNSDPVYNDIQCGHGPANDAPDETDCPGRVDLGPSGCSIIGPTFDMAWLSSRPIFGGNDGGNDGGIITGNVSIRAEINNLYVCSENGGIPMNANRAAIGSWEVFTVNNEGGGKVSLRGNNGKYVSSENGGGPITCNRSAVGPWELFTLEPQGGNVYAIKGNNGRYLSCELGQSPMTCNRFAVGTWERFSISNTNKTPGEYFADVSARDVAVAPNPAFHMGDVEMTFDLEQRTQTSFSVFTMNGQKVAERVIGDLGIGSFSFSLGEFGIGIESPGLYLLTMQLGENTITKRIIVQ